MPTTGRAGGGSGAALDEATALLRLASFFRPLPDLTILITDDASAAIERAQRRDKRTYTPEQADFMHEASELFERLAATAPARYRVIDRRDASEHEAAQQIFTWLNRAGTCLGCAPEPWQHPGASCMYCGGLTTAEPA